MKLKEFENRVLLVLIVILIYSYAIEAIFFNNIDITIPTFFILCSVILFLVLKNNSIKTLLLEDYLILVFVIYILLHSIFISELMETIKVIFGSLVAFFIGRYADIKRKSHYEFIKKVINICGYVLLTAIIINFLNGSNQYRVTVGDTHPVAIGELLGIFSLINLFDEKGINKNKWGITNAIIGLFMMIAIVGSRGALFSTILSILLILFVLLPFKKRIYLLLLTVFLIYTYITITTTSYLLTKFPTISRFSLYNIINDPSVTGSHEYIGRFDVYSESIRLFKENPIFGAGINKVYSHNVFLELLATTGIMGFSIMLLFFTTIFLNIKLLIKEKFGFWLISLFLFVFIYRQTSFTLSTSKSVFLFAGMITSLYLYKYKKGENK